MSDGGDIIRSRRALLASVGVVLLLGTAALLYVFFGPASKYARFAHGGLRYLKVLAQPPLQPAQALYDADGGVHHLSEFRGRIVLVNYWATWCVPCVEELPTLGALQRRYQGRLRIVAVSADAAADRAKAVAELRRLHADNLTFLQDPTRNVLFDITGGVVPTTILYDAQGRELVRVAGKANWTSPEAIAFVEAALKAEVDEHGPGH